MLTLLMARACSSTSQMWRGHPSQGGLLTSESLPTILKQELGRRAPVRGLRPLPTHACPSCCSRVKGPDIHGPLLWYISSHTVRASPIPTVPIWKPSYGSTRLSPLQFYWLAPFLDKFAQHWWNVVKLESQCFVNFFWNIKKKFSFYIFLVFLVCILNISSCWPWFYDYFLKHKEFRSVGISRLFHMVLEMKA